MVRAVILRLDINFVNVSQMLSYPTLFLVSCFLGALQVIALGSPNHLKSHDWPMKRGRPEKVEHQDFNRKSALRPGLVRKSVRSTEEESTANRIVSAPVATRNENSKPKNRITWSDLVHEIGTINNKAAEKRENGGSTSGEKEVTSNPTGVSLASSGPQLAAAQTVKPMAGGGACAGGAGGTGAGPCAGKCPSSSTEKPNPPPVIECPTNLDTMFVCPKCRTHYTVRINVRESKCGHCCGVPIPCCDDAKVGFAGPSEIENLVQPEANQLVANFQQVQTRARKQTKRKRFHKIDSKRSQVPKSRLHQYLTTN